MRWNALGSWSDRGDRQTESFDVTTGSLRLVWRSDSRLRVTLHSSISGRPLDTVVDVTGAGADTVRFAAEPRVAYLLIEADQEGWSLTLEEGIPAPE
jgi:hypothetical protein